MEAVSVLFVLPSGGGGGGSNSVAQEARGLSQLGIDVCVAVNTPNHSKLVANYPELQARNIPVLSYANPAELAQQLKISSVVVATTNASVYDVCDARAELQEADPQARPRFAYYVQDYEPLFYPAHSERWTRARKSYTALADGVLFAKTQWLCDIVYANHGIKVEKVKPSIDHDVHYPDLRRPNKDVTIAAMLRPSTQRRAPRRTARIMRAIGEKHSASLHVFGAGNDELLSAGIELPANVRNWGVLRRTEVPELLRNSDLFLDLSDYQAFGRTGLEAMACGCIPLVPALGGVTEYASHGRNAFVVDTRCDRQVLNAVDNFMSMEPATRAAIRHSALETGAEFTIVKSALSELRLFRRLASA